jgi:hypothetical protein
MREELDPGYRFAHPATLAGVLICTHPNTNYGSHANAYLDVNEWQVAGVKRAMASLDRGEVVPHQEVRDWVNSWGRKPERSAFKHAAT